jgi:hypothetical protein
LLAVIMPLPPDIIQAWLVGAVIAAVVIRVIAIVLKKRPRLYLVLWCCAVLVFGMAAVWWVHSCWNIPLYSERKPGGAPGSLPTPGQLALMLLLPVGMIIPFSNLLALGFSPPYYHVSRRAWWLGVIPALASIGMATALLAMDRRYRDDFRVAQARPAAPPAGLRQWNEVAAPDPVVGPTRRGEWAFLGGVPKYTAELGGDLVQLDFSSPGRGLPQFRPEALKWLAKEKSLQKLRFYGLLNDDDVIHLKPLTWLKELELVRTAITDKGLAELTTMTSLEHLELIEAPVTAASLPVLAEFPALRRVYLSGTQISHEELRQFGFDSPIWKGTARGLERE